MGEKFKQVIPVFRKIDAVCYDHMTKEIYKLPVMSMALKEAVDEEGNAFRKVVPVTWNVTHQIFDSEEDDITEEERFLGLEFDGKELDWTRAIEKLEHELKEGQE